MSGDDESVDDSPFAGTPRDRRTGRRSPFRLFVHAGWNPDVGQSNPASINSRRTPYRLFSPPRGVELTE